MPPAPPGPRFWLDDSRLALLYISKKPFKPDYLSRCDGLMGQKRRTNKMMGLKLKVLTSKAEPQMAAMTRNLGKKVDKKTKGLKNPKIKRDELLLLCLTNPYRH